MLNPQLARRQAGKRCGAGAERRGVGSQPHDGRERSSNPSACLRLLGHGLQLTAADVIDFMAGALPRPDRRGAGVYGRKGDERTRIVIRNVTEQAEADEP
jgi:hypothetical protein